MKILTTHFFALYSSPVPLLISLDSKYFFTSVSTQRINIEIYIRADVNVIRHGFEFFWIPGKENIADRATKSDSSLTKTMHLALFDVRLPLGFPTTESCASAQSLG